MNHICDSGQWATSDRLAADDRSSHLEPGRSLAPAGSGILPVDMLRAVEAEIIPGVLLARRNRKEVEEAAAAPDDPQIALFAQILLRHGDAAGASAFVETIRARGFSVEDVYLRVFQPVSRHLDELWAADVCTFVEVTLALGVLQRLLRELSPAFHKHVQRCDFGRQALLVALPGDHHTFGLSMVAEFLRRSAWSVWTALFDSRADLGDIVRDTWFTVVGFSVGCEDKLGELAAAIRVVRRESCNGAVGILVGGPVFVEHPDRVTRVGADAMALDARQAVFQAERFAGQMAGR